MFCDVQLKKYKNGVFKNVKLISFNKYKTTANGSSIRKNKIITYDLTIELPLDIVQETLITTIHTTNHKVRKYKDMDYIDVYIIYCENSKLIDGVYIKEDLKTSSEKYLSLVLGAVFAFFSIMDFVLYFV